MSAKVVHKGENIVRYGYCEFSAGAGEEVVDLGDFMFPANFTRDYKIENGQAILRDAPWVDPAVAARIAGNAALTAGLQITFVGIPELDGVFPLDANTQSNIMATGTYILMNGTFPRGLEQMPWTDIDGAPRVIPSIAVFKVFATAIADYTSSVLLYINSGGAQGSLPDPHVTLD